MVDTQQSTRSVLRLVERIQQELAHATSIDDFFGKDGIFARLFADTREQMLEAELTAHLGYPLSHEAWRDLTYTQMLTGTDL